jgi:hypothetical protein
MPVAAGKRSMALVLAFAGLALVPSRSRAAVDATSDCAGLQHEHRDPVLGEVVAPTPHLPRPAKGVMQLDPAFHTCVVRATDHAAEPPSTAFTRNDYARRQAFNANNTRFIAYASGGAWVLYDANTLAFLRVLNGPAGDAEPQWDPIDPHTLIYVPNNGGMKLLRLDVESNVTTVAADFAGRLPWSDAARVWTHSEGSPSADGRYWCLLAETSSFGALGVFTYDLQANTILGTKALDTSPDWVSMSPSGRSCVVSGTTAYDRTFTTSRTLLDGSEHADLALGADGHDYYVYVDFADTGYIRMVDIDTGVNTPLFPTYINGATTSLHISGKAFSRPGWALISTFNHSGTTEQWLHERVMAFELKASPKLINLAHHHSKYNEYWTQPQASVSRDFSRVMFTSNWGSTSATDVDAYMLVLPGVVPESPPLRD